MIAKIGIGGGTGHVFEYTGSASRQVALDSTYVDAKGTAYSGTVTLAPYTSLVLMK